MKYDLSKLSEEVTVKLEWHGEPTQVMLAPRTEKVEVRKNDVVEVSLDMAKTLLAYSDLWTKEGDEPEVQPWREAQRQALAKDKEVAVEDKDEDEELTDELIAKMKKPELLERLQDLKIELTGDEKVADLKEMLLGVLNGDIEDEDIVEDEDEGEE